MVFNVTFNNISVILWQSVLLVQATGLPRENHRPVPSHRQTLSHNVVSLSGIGTHNINILESLKTCLKIVLFLILYEITSFCQLIDNNNNVRFHEMRQILVNLHYL